MSKYCRLTSSMCLTLQALEFGDNMTGGTLTSSDNAQQDFAAPLHVSQVPATPHVLFQSSAC